MFETTPQGENAAAATRSTRPVRPRTRLTQGERAAGSRRGTPFVPFRDTSVTARFARVLEEVLDDIHTLDDAVVRTESPAALKRRFVGRARLAPLVLDIADRRVVGGTQAAVREVVVPFAGDPLLWTVRPTGCFPGGLADECPEIAVEAGAVRFTCIADATDAAAAGLGHGVEEALGALAAAVARMARDVKRHNADAFKAVCRALQMKRARARAALQGGTTAAVSPLPATPRRPPVGMLPPPSGWRTNLAAPCRSGGRRRRGFELSDGEFERIMWIIDGCGAALGRSPTAARSLDADLVRTFLLIQLNAHYRGAGGREAFTASGDGDIHLAAGGRVALVARVCLWRRADAARGADIVERAVADMRADCGSKQCQGVLLLFHPDRLQREARHALHDAVALLNGRGRRRVTGGGVEARSVLATPDAAGGTIVVRGMTCGLRRG
jgi:hypothetical protein